MPDSQLKSDRRTLRRYLAIVQDPRGYPAEGLEPAPPDGPEQPMLYTVVKADEHEAEVARLREALESIRTFLGYPGGDDTHQRIGEACGADLCIVCLAHATATEALSRAATDEIQDGETA